MTMSWRIAELTLCMHACIHALLQREAPHALEPESFSTIATYSVSLHEGAIELASL